MLKDRILTFEELIKELLSVYNDDGEIVDDGWTVYYKDVKKIKKTTECCISDSIIVTDDDEEVYPSYAVQNDMVSYVTDEIIVDVITEYLMEKSKPTVKQLIDAINYYLENDCFIYVEPDDNAYKKPQIVIEKEITDKRVLMKIRKAFSLEIPLGEFVEQTRNIPYIIDVKLTLPEAKRIVKNNELKDYVTVKF